MYKEIQTKPMKMEGAEWSHTTAAARELISGLLEKDPAKRYTIEQALEHPWVTGEAGTAPISKSIIKSMQNFNRKNKFKKDALKLIARCAMTFSVLQQSPLSRLPLFQHSLRRGSAKAATDLPRD